MPRRPSGLVLGGGGAGGGALTDWTLLDSVTEGAGAPNDTNALGDTGTAFSSSTFRHVWASSVTTLDGYRDGLLWWSYPLQTLYPSYDPETQIIQLACDFKTPNQFGLGVADGAGVFVGISDAGLDSGTPNAAVVGFHRSGVSAYQARKLNTTTGTSGGTVSDGDEIFATIEPVAASSAWRPMVSYYFRNTGSSPETYTIASNSPSFETLSTTIANWIVVTGSYHANTTDPAALDVKWQLYHRVVSKASGQLA